MTTTQWAREYRRLSAKSTALPGKYNPDLTPWIAGMHAALDDPATWKVVCRKSAQVAWTDGALLNYIGRRMHLDPCPMIVMFAKEGGGKKFDREKFGPMVEATPVLAELLPSATSRGRGNTWDHKAFPGGFLNLVGSNSPDSVKSTPAPVVAVEEPDDSNTNVKQQGDTITLLEERTKSFARRKIIFGGTPTIEGFSRVDAAYQASDRREFWVPCQECGEFQTLTWAQVKATTDPALSHPVHGQVNPESARYLCAHCGALWSDSQKNRAVRKGEWRAAAPFNGVAGFAINELYSPFPGSALARLVEKRLAAEYALAQGDDTKLRSFRNNTEGLAYAYGTTVPSADKLKERAEDYRPLTIPHPGLVLTAGVDVQHDRLAVIIRAWGRGEESWLVWWGEIYGRTMLLQWGENGAINRETSGAWAELDDLLSGQFEHASGARISIRAATVDSGDGQTMDAVYAYVRRRLNRGFMAGKGESHDPKRDIFSPPKLSIDTTYRHKPHPSGVRPYMIGTQVAKDLMLGVDEQGGRVKLTGYGPGRMHTYKDVRPDYFDQLTAEVKVPHRSVRGRLVWQCLAGRRNEALDCEVMALHAARSLKLQLWQDARWAAEESAVQQPQLFAPSQTTVPSPARKEAPQNQPIEEQPSPGHPPPSKRPNQSAKPAKARPGWSANRW